MMLVKVRSIFTPVSFLWYTILIVFLQILDPNYPLTLWSLDVCCKRYDIVIILFYYYFQAHSASVWKVTWAHPEFGSVLATCSFDRTAAIWEELSELLNLSMFISLWNTQSTHIVASCFVGLLYCFSLCIWYWRFTQSE